jgi:hypothetical protein
MPVEVDAVIRTAQALQQIATQLAQIGQKPKRPAKTNEPHPRKG